MLVLIIGRLNPGISQLFYASSHGFKNVLLIFAACILGTILASGVGKKSMGTAVLVLWK